MLLLKLAFGLCTIYCVVVGDQAVRRAVKQARSKDLSIRVLCGAEVFGTVVYKSIFLAGALSSIYSVMGSFAYSNDSITGAIFCSLLVSAALGALLGAFTATFVVVFGRWGATSARWGACWGTVIFATFFYGQIF